MNKNVYFAVFGYECWLDVKTLWVR